MGSQLEVSVDQQTHIPRIYNNVSHLLYHLQTIARVRVTITDVNDNIPQFGSSSYTASFPENISLGAVVLVVS